MSKWLHERVGERGSVLVLALLVTLLILGVGLSVMWVSSSGAKSAGNLMRRQEALYSAEAGIERARAILNAATDWSDLLKGGPSAGCTPTPVALDPNKGRILCDVTAGPAVMQDIQVIEASTATASATSNKLANLKYTIWIRNDPVDSAGYGTGVGSGSGSSAGTAGGDPETDTDFRVIVRVEGKGRDGLAFVALEAVISRNAFSGAALRYQQAGINGQGNNSFQGSIASP